MVEKIKVWFEKAGFTSIVYLAIALGIFFFGSMIPLVGGLKRELFGAFLAVFCYINWNTIVKIYKKEVKSKIDELADKIGEKIEEKL